ncbi:1-deoxy-D-xylulose-5-phosphate synthase [Erysipelothrix larvae]|uniref:1-deoxy-D-xylulose-5-phosphate synthase n=1 Tax=Erysipelothrix larvae TaxID=1514105 RepID=A0A0X8GYP4_9FIRM|nr:1-deoxy-D-xylulose-5-phosphate synthase [Erysipelothrix larvae]AMC92858.1 1-deoxy-D-xylulose-5-phosphate synthase [Erysipelothrix larvae]
MILETIQSPQDLKALSHSDLHTLVDEAREALIQKISHHGGHSGPNLGVVEMTVALHRVFDSPTDKLIFDVSHQTYVHKMLTGRAYSFLDVSQYDAVSGYTNPCESEHDLFTVGHTSTSLSLANGVAKARDLKGETYNVIALIGDGSLSGGLAYEGLNNIVELGSNTIVIVNDNDQSIAENHGGIYQNLRALRQSKGRAPNNFFKAMGFEYHYLDNGNDLDALLSLFESLKDCDHPVLCHIHTLKGKGLDFAEKNRESYHAGGPFDRETGAYVTLGQPQETYQSLITQALMAKMAHDPEVVVVNAGTPSILFNKTQREQIGKQFVDVGIAEGHAATMVAGLAKNGVKPIWAVFSTFMQRSYDSISHDIALNNLPATILVFGASINGMKDQSHLGIFDIPFLASIPNLIYLAPTNKEETFAMLEWSCDQNDHPVAIRVPVGEVVETNKQTNFDICHPYDVIEGDTVMVIGVGNFYALAQAIVKGLKEDHKINATLVNPKVLSGVPLSYLNNISPSHQIVVTLEDGVCDGGYGQRVSSALGHTSIKVFNYGLSAAFHDRYDVNTLLEDHGLSVSKISAKILDELKGSH